MMNILMKKLRKLLKIRFFLKNFIFKFKNKSHKILKLKTTAFKVKKQPSQKNKVSLIRRHAEEFLLPPSCSATGVRVARESEPMSLTLNGEVEMKNY